MVGVGVEQDLDVVVGVDVVAVRERGADDVAVLLVGPHPEPDGVGRVPHQHFGRVLRRPSVDRPVLRESDQVRRAPPHRLIEHAIDAGIRLHPRGRDVELSFRAVVGGRVGNARLEGEQ